MNDPVAIAARAAAQQLKTEAGPGLVAEVEAVLATCESPFAPPQYVDPVALASLIVAIASLAWTVYGLWQVTPDHCPRAPCRADPGGAGGRAAGPGAGGQPSVPRWIWVAYHATRSGQLGQRVLSLV